MRWIRNLFAGAPARSPQGRTAQAPPQPSAPADPLWRPQPLEGWEPPKLVGAEYQNSPVGQSLYSRAMHDEVYAATRLDLAYAEAQVGEDTPALVGLLVIAARSATTAGDWPNGERLARRAMAIGEAYDLPPAARVSMHLQLGTSYRARGDRDQALACYEAALDNLRRAYGDQDPRVAKYEDFIEGQTPEEMAAFSLEHEDMAPLRADLEAATKAGNLDRRESCAAELLSQSIALNGACHPRTAQAFALHAEALGLRGYHGAARESLLHLADLTALHEGRDAPATEEALRGVAKNRSLVLATADDRRSGLATGVSYIRCEGHLYTWLMPALEDAA